MYAAKCDPLKSEELNLEEQFLDVLESFMDYGRNDIHAEAFLDNREARWKYKPVVRPVDRDALRLHHRYGPYLGRYFISPGTSVVRLGALDFDDHESELHWDDMRNAAATVAEHAVRLGYYPYAVRSGGGRGIHIFFFWAEDQPAAAVREFLQTAISATGYKEGSGGLAKGEIEIFPKQCEVADGEFGNLIALPFGRNSVPLNRDFEIVRSPQNLILSPPVPITSGSEKSETDGVELSTDLTAISEALTFLNADDYGVWIKSGLGLKESLGDAGFALWDTFSRRSETKYEGEAATRKRWDRLKPRSGGLTVASIFYWAEKNGWKRIHQPTEPHFADFTDVLKAAPEPMPFPLDALPGPFHEYVGNIAAAMQVQPDLVAVPLLTAAATMLGRDWLIRPQGQRSTWTEPSILWTACVADSGSMKSAAAKEGIRFVQDLQLTLRARYREDLAGWQNAKKDGADPGPKPLLESCYVADSTVESLKLTLSDDHNRNPRGILCFSDELAGWFNSLDQYKGKGNDRQVYLSLYDGGFVRIDRKSDGDPVIIPRTGLSICGGLQPAVVAVLFRNGDDGLTPRFQVVWPAAYPEVKLRGADIDAKAFSDTAERLMAMRNARPTFGNGSDLAPDHTGEPLYFSQAAQIRFDTWCVAIRNRRESGVFGSYIEKQRGLLGRLSMILHGMEHGESMGNREIALATLERAITLVSYFESHARKLYGTIDAHPARSGALKIAKWIRDRKRAAFTPRDIRQNGWAEFKKERDEAAILASLQYLEAFGWLRIDEKRPGKQGGRPTLLATVNPLALND